MVKKLEQWPPVNKMAAHFTGKLYIDFSGSESDYTTKIQELVKCINDSTRALNSVEIVLES